MENLLVLENVLSGYEQEAVIQKITFTVEEGEFLGLIGPNGAGKSTLLRVLTRILNIWEGKIIFKGKDWETFSAKQFSKEVAFLPQNIETPFPFSVEEFILLGRYPYFGYFGQVSLQDKQLVEEIMTLTDTMNLKDKKINHLSGGEKQRVFLAQTLIQEPKLLLLDEPVAHLDIRHQIEILDLIKKQNQEKGTTVVAVFHDLNLASEYCERLILMNQGKIYKTGTPEEVLTYQDLEQVYKTVVVVEKNPFSHKPYVLLVPQWNKNSLS